MTTDTQLRRARQLLAVHTRRMQEHMQRCPLRARRCRSCVAVYNRVAGMTAILRLFEGEEWGR